MGSFLQEFKDAGAIPLGIHADAMGEMAYWWVVFDPSRFPSEDALYDHLRRRSPTGLKMVVLAI